jgi:hypothetical protein
MRITMKSLLVALMLSCAFGSSAWAADIVVKHVIDITPKATVVLGIENETGLVPIPVRFKGVLYPEGASSLSDLVGALREYLKEADGTQFRILSIGDAFGRTEDGVLVGVIEIKTSKKTNDGARVGGTQDLIADLLNFGACAYDGSLAESDPKRHKIYTTAQDHAKNNMFGVWSTK